ncbi:hypothetical protein ILYODFUR_023460 [Ilyodon furcidens]|uniref:Uncharacterized protein n=1 Tax=Ilyodon furcidens TaxID=33524 RepID=A0ABV0TMY7_9TELE
MPLPAPCLMPLALETLFLSLDLRLSQATGLFSLSPHGSQVYLKLLSRGQSQLCVPVTASADSPEDLDQSAIRLQSVGFFLINCLDHILFWILRLIPRLRSDSLKLTAALLLSDPELLNKPF